MTDRIADDAAATAGIRPIPKLAIPTAKAAGVRLRPVLRRRVVQMTVDLVTVLGAATLTYQAYLVSGLGRRHFDPLLYFKLHIALAVLTVFALAGAGEYSREQGLLRIESIRRILQAVGAGVLLTLALSYLMQISAFSRLSMLAVGPAIAVALTAQRFVIWAVRDRYRRLPSRPVVVYGAGETGRLLAQHLLDEHQLGLVPAALLDDDAALHGESIRIGAGTEGARLPVAGGEDDLDRVLAETGADAVFLALPSARPERLQQLVARLEERGVRYFCVPSAGDLLFSSLSFGQLGGIPVFTRRLPAADRPYELLKRAIDVAGATAILALTSPLLGLGALLVKLTTHGPVFFRQERIGLGGEPFTIWKLRTMRPDAPRYAHHPASAADTRVTRVGQFLRRTSIDELPQLFNVLRGEMSLVGPRPEMPFIVFDYDQIQRLRLTVKPGLTGLWQISADRAFRIHDNMQYDLYYVERRSTLLDLAILFVTPFVLLARNRAR